MKKPHSQNCPIIVALLLLIPPAIGRCATSATDIAARAINALAIDLLHNEIKSDANALLSPYSIQTALAMAYAGAAGETRAEMARVLHYPADEQSLHQSFRALRGWVEGVTQEEGATRSRVQSSTNDPVIFYAANRLYGQTGFGFKQEFLEFLRKNYDTPFETVDFRKNSDAAAQQINDWVGTQTRQRIRDIIPNGMLDERTGFVLVNAIYLKAPWDYPFEPGETRPDTFYIKGGKSTTAPFMRQKRKDVTYFENGEFSAVLLPCHYSMRFLVLLPKDVDGLASIESKLTPDLLSGKLDWTPREVTLYMPKLKLEPAAIVLDSALRALGMKTAFDQGSANFERIAPKGLWLSHVLHKTYLNLDEQGVEAAAITAADVSYGIDSTKPVVMRIDHPFLFAIVARESGACLFLGHVANPR